MNSSEPMLAIKNITVWRGDNLLLDDVSFSLNPGQVLQVKGANGSGKTTLLRIVCGVGLADEGDVHWHGAAIHKCRDQFNDSLLYLGHKAGIKGGLTATENLRIFSRLAGREPGLQTEQAIESALEHLSIKSKAHIACRFLSAGQQRRVSLARLLLQSAKLWVLDEPLTSLDADGLTWVQTQIVDHVAKGGAVLLTTHAPLVVNNTTVDTLELG